MKDIEEINSYDDIETYYDVQIPQFIQTILENRTEALKHCVNYKKEIERLNDGLKDIKYFIEKNITSFSDLYIPASDVVCILNIINRTLGSDK